ncbi:type II toxin-antitoxin system RelE/ParE family toxin [Methylobacter sp.]|uniref:type II toxin-antitoxin system RelE/ParE family toxin n=1 Tax=Methylobacter sp. TaxID=2051955 RepID=UPI00248875A3|nr:type II toxin-antitoxin system RelE/ParE family toxin [Methylobacter sp.]MDI1277091.1 type II toxin-antitoxin system RelE/ParE family toxin [Methylobacter sp.]MDI1359648.1 type II toxin-antitoxin system RelE/ParE family toxin [Methylobacter sp.]
MSLPITFHRAASEEFIEASVWYEAKRPGLAVEFMTEIDRCVSLASEYPFQFAIVREDIRRVVANHFPYNVYFRAEQHRIVVLAVFHGSRDPSIWLARA